MNTIKACAIDLSFTIIYYEIPQVYAKLTLLCENVNK